MQEVVLPRTWPARYVTGLKKKKQMCTLSNVTVQLMVCRSKHFMSKSVQSRWRLHETDFVKCYNWFHIWTVRFKLFTKKLVVVFLTLVVCPWLVCCFGDRMMAAMGRRVWRWWTWWRGRFWVETRLHWPVNWMLGWRRTQRKCRTSSPGVKH